MTMTATVSKKQVFDACVPECPATFDKGYAQPLCGIDEVGRGPLAGPVLSACVHIRRGTSHMEFWKDITDSKKLTAKKRDRLFPLIQKHSFWGVGIASVAEIDELNIHHATLLAMKRAYNHMTERYSFWPQTLLIDGKFIPDIDCPHKNAVIKGDSKSRAIAAASVLAKTMRDRMMAELHQEFPFYGWDRNAGYGTASHMKGLAENGATPHHRRSYAPVRALLGRR